MRCKFLSLNQQTTCVDVSFSTRCPYAIVLSIDRWIKEEFFLISKEYSFQVPDFEKTQKIFGYGRGVSALLHRKASVLECVDRQTDASQLLLFSNRTSADCQLLSDVACTLASHRMHVTARMYLKIFPPLNFTPDLSYLSLNLLLVELKI